MKNPKFSEMTSSNYVDFNEEKINKWVDDERYWGDVCSPEEYAKAKSGDWDVALYCKPVPKAWFIPYLHNNRLDGVKILGLASGGGQQIPILQAVGANCTVMDYSASQLECEQLVAKREGYEINLVKADMTQTFPFDNGSFYIIFHPISNHFVEDIYHVWHECYRVLKPGGILMAGMYKDWVYMMDDEGDQLSVKYKLPFNPLKDRELYESYVEPDSDENLTFSHSLEECIDGQLKAKFTLTDLFEIKDESLYSQYNSIGFCTRAVKAGD